jgi:hypothetical protein
VLFGRKIGHLATVEVTNGLREGHELSVRCLIKVEHFFVFSEPSLGIHQRLRILRKFQLGLVTKCTH